MGRRRRSSPEERQIPAGDRRRKGIQVMSTEKSPEWLPDGWIMEVRMTKSGSKYRYYTSPVSGCTFRTKREVLRYLNIDKVVGDASRTTCLGNNNKQLVAQVKDSPEWLPNGWILEIKTRMSGAKAGQKYKCYFDPLTGSRFYSKKEVFRYLKAGKLLNSSSDQKRLLSTNSVDNVLAQIQYSPDGLPHGWIKETKFRKSNKYSGVRKDPYYTDPVTGYVFRSLRDALHYVETGEVSKYAIKSQNRHISDIYSLEKESPPPISSEKLKSHGTTVRRCLFAGQIPDSDGQMMMDVDGSHEPTQSTPYEHASQCADCTDLICLPPSNDKHVERKSKRKNMEEPATEESSKPAEHLEVEAKKKKVLDPATENLEKPTRQFKANGKKGRKKVLDPETEKFSAGKVKMGLEKVLDPTVEKPSEPVSENPLDEMPPDSSDTKQPDLANENRIQDKLVSLEPESEELSVIESNPLDPTVEKPSEPVSENPVDEMPPDSSDAKQPDLANENSIQDKLVGLEPESKELSVIESNPLDTTVDKSSEPVSENPLDEMPPDSSDAKQPDLANENSIQDKPEGLEPESEELSVIETNPLDPTVEKASEHVSENPLDEMPPDSSDAKLRDLTNQNKIQDKLEGLEPESEELSVIESNPLDPTVKNPSEPVSENPLDEMPPDSSDAKLPDLTNQNRIQDKQEGLDPESEELSVIESNPLDPTVKNPSEPVSKNPLDEIPPDSSDSKQPDLTNENRIQDKPEGLEPETKELSVIESNLLEPVSEKKSSVLEENPLKPENENSLLPEEKQSQPERKVRKRGSSKSSTIPRRASRRLAGIEAIPVADLVIRNRSRGSMLKEQSVQTEDTVPSEKPDSEEPLGEPTALEEEAGGAAKPTSNWPESQLPLTFGDSWLDPCIEFAFKTLTGDLEDTAAIEDYFQQQLIPVQSSSSSPSAMNPGSLTFGSPESCSQAKLPVQLEPPDKSHTSR